MRSFLVAFTGLMLLATGAAQAKIAITVDKNAQLMTVAQGAWCAATAARSAARSIEQSSGWLT